MRCMVPAHDKLSGSGWSQSGCSSLYSAPSSIRRMRSNVGSIERTDIRVGVFVGERLAYDKNDGFSTYNNKSCGYYLDAYSRTTLTGDRTKEGPYEARRVSGPQIARSCHYESSNPVLCRPVVRISLRGSNSAGRSVSGVQSRMCG